MRSNIKCSFLICFLLSLHIRCDLPVHCKMEEIAGNWTFRIDKTNFQPDLRNSQTNCGHGYPDRIETTQGDANFQYESYFDIELLLSKDYKIYEKNGKLSGNWTPVYDEGFIVYYNDSIFTAFMKYFTKHGESSSKDYTSNCDKTMIGWYIPDKKFNDRNWHCFFGFKTFIKNQFTPARTRFMNIMNNPYDDQGELQAQETNFMEVHVGTEAGYSLTLMKYDQHEIVNELNSLNLPWKAEVHDEFRGLSFFELKEKLGLKGKRHSQSQTQKSSLSSEDNVNRFFDGSNQPSFVEKNENTDIFLDPPSSNVNDFFYDNGPNSLYDNNKSSQSYFDNFNYNFNPYPVSPSERDSQFETDYSIVSKYIDKELQDIDINKLPKNWDWRNVGGVNYVPHLRRQDSCGSCYIFSLVASLESRLRIMTNNRDTTSFSRQFPLACSFYTEGCEGGYPIFVAKFFNEFEIIPESCAEYNPKRVNCSLMCDYSKNPKKYFVSRYEYLGGFYGATNEIDLIKEIRARGPIPGNMSVPWSFSYYKNGIFSEKSLTRNAGKFSKTTMFDQKLSWSNVDHSILLIGYGEENGTKYWIGMNTWGDGWGEDGYFRLLRGENDCNIETMGDAARLSFKAR